MDQASIVSIAVVGFLLFLSYATRDFAKADYNNALKALKEDPTNPELRKRAAKAGVKYQKLLVRNGYLGGADEQFIENQLNDIAPNPNRNSIGKLGSQQPAEQTIESRLTELKRLHESELITDEEYQSSKARILESL